MFRRLLLPACLCLLIAGASLTTAPACDDEEERQAEANRRAGAAIRKLADALDARDFDRQAEAVARTHDLEHVMNQFKPRNKGGLGVGEKGPPVGVLDSIELTIINLGTRRAPSAAEVARNKDAYLRMARQTQAIAAVTYWYPLPANTRPELKKNWKTWSGETRAAAKDLADAVEAGDPVRVKQAAEKLNAACNRCHTTYEDR